MGFIFLLCAIAFGLLSVICKVLAVTFEIAVPFMIIYAIITVLCFLAMFIWW